MLLEIIIYYWPRLIFAAYFTFVNTVLIKKVFQQKYVFVKAILLFFFSYPVVSIVTEVLRTRTFNRFFEPLLIDAPSANYRAVYLIVYFFCDAVSLILPIYIFNKIMKDRLIISACLYLIYVVMDRYALTVSVSQVTYMIVIVIELVALMVVTGDDVQFVAQNAKIIDWKPMIHYIVGLFFLLEALYGAYYVFPEVTNGTMNLSSIWIDGIATITTVFFGSFVKINTVSAKNQLAKIEYMKKLQENSYNIILKLTEISEAKSGETGQHVKRVSEYSAILAEEVGMTPEDVESIRIASMMHDVGKLLIPKEIIEKPGRLTPDESEVMKEHTTYGKELLAKSYGEVLSMARLIANEHHERWDGTGYPAGLAGEEISTYAQIVAVADVYDALTSKRSYKEAWDRYDAKAEIESQKGKQFSPLVVEAFERCFDKICAIQDQYVDEE